jgi:hypothetical protein
MIDFVHWHGRCSLGTSQFEMLNNYSFSVSPKLLALVAMIASVGCTNTTADGPHNVSPADSESTGGDSTDGGSDLTGRDSPWTTSPGWALLSPTERGALDALLRGVENPWSKAAVPIAKAKIAEPAWPSTPAAAQATFFRSLWTDPAVSPHQISFLELSKARTPLPFTLDAAVPIGSQEFVGGSADALRVDMHVDDRVVGLFGPATPPNDVFLLTPADCAAAVARLPAPARGLIKNIVVNPFRNPADADIDKQLGVVGFRAFMRASSTNRVDVFPQVRKRDDVTDVMLHETGHVWSDRDLDDAGWKAWDDAAKADGHFISKYASTVDSEDLAETWAVYAGLAEGSRAVAEVEAMFPARFAFIRAHAPR